MWWHWGYKREAIYGTFRNNDKKNYKKRIWYFKQEINYLTGLSLTQYAQYVCEQEIADRGRQYWEKNRNKGAVMHPFTDFFET